MDWASASDFGGHRSSPIDLPISAWVGVEGALGAPLPRCPAALSFTIARPLLSLPQNLNEAKYINESLFHLEQVIIALQERGSVRAAWRAPCCALGRRLLGREMCLRALDSLLFLLPSRSPLPRDKFGNTCPTATAS